MEVLRGSHLRPVLPADLMEEVFFFLDLATGVFFAHRVDRPLWPLGAMESLRSGVVGDSAGSVPSGHGMGRDPRRVATPCTVPREERGRKEVL